MIDAIAHVNLRIPQGGEEAAARFWCDALGFTEHPKPASNTHPGRWFTGPGFEIHVSPDADFVPATKAHISFVAGDLKGLIARLETNGVAIRPARGTAEEPQSCFFDDPFGNRLELMTPEAAAEPD